MQFVIIPKTRRVEYHLRSISGHIEAFTFNDFDCELQPYPAVERIAVSFAPDLDRELSREMWPAVEAGVRRGVEEASTAGLYLCCAQFTLLSGKQHEGTAEYGVHCRVADCVRSFITAGYAEPIPPLRIEWLTSDVLALARGIHTNAALDGIPALTDALIEAGCDDPLVMEHLRTCPDHGPSCWVVEMILDAVKS